MPKVKNNFGVRSLVCGGVKPLASPSAKLLDLSLTRVASYFVGIYMIREVYAFFCKRIKSPSWQQTLFSLSFAHQACFPYACC